MKYKIFFSMFLFVFLLIGVSASVSADIAPPVQPLGGDIGIWKDTMVQMVSEVVEIDVLDVDMFDNYRATKGLADVDAIFWMKNQGDVDESLPVYFPMNFPSDIFDSEWMPEISGFKVKVNDEWVNWERVELNLVENHYLFGMQSWAVFDVDFPIGEEVVIEVEYQIPAVSTLGKNEFSYVFETGRGWFGLIEQADLIFNLPFIASEFNVENFHYYQENGIVDGNQIKFHYDDFEPYRRNNFHIVIMDADIERGLVEAVENIALDASYENLKTLSDVLFEVTVDRKPLRVWKDYIYLYENLLMKMNEMKPDDLEVRAKLAIVTMIHKELHNWGILLSVPLPVQMDFVDDVMFDLENLDDDEKSYYERWSENYMIDLHYRFFDCDENGLYLSDYVPQGSEIPPAAKGTLKMVLNILP